MKLLIMKVKSKFVDPFDLWANSDKSSKKLHPSQKRKLKNPPPHPGQSYNPHPEDHKKLLNKIAKDELSYIKKKKSIDNALKVNVDEDLSTHKEELIDSGDETDPAFSDYDEKDFEAISKDKAVKEKRKTRQQRMRQLKDKLQRKAAKLRKLKNIRSSKIDGVKKIIKELDNEALVSKKKSLKLRKERFSQKLEKSDPIYCLSSDIPAELRNVKCPMDKIVREQLESFKSRLMIEPTSFQAKKKKSTKSFVRGSM